MEKRYYQYCMRLMVALLLLTEGCKKAPINNEIEGMWKLEEFTTHEDGEKHACKRIYYSIQLWVVDIAEKQGGHGYKSSVGRLNYKSNNTLIMKDFHYRKQTTDNKEKTSVEDLIPFGLNSLETTFEIIKVDGHNLILCSDYATLHFTKF